MTAVPAERLADVFVEVADTLVDEFDLIEFLQMVTSRTAELVEAAATGLLLADHQGQLQFMAASEEGTKLLELFALQNHEGPCLDCFRTGRPVTNADLAAAADRWPLFAPRAVEAGYRSVHAIPLRLRSDTVGALNLFGHHRAAAGADHPPRRAADRAAAVGAQQSGHHRAGQGSGRADILGDCGRGLRAVARLRPPAS